MTSGAVALSLTDVAFFTPPHRSRRPEWRSEGGERMIALFRTFRRELVKTADLATGPFRGTGHTAY